jgi:hypothetical protein
MKERIPQVFEAVFKGLAEAKGGDCQGTPLGGLHDRYKILVVAAVPDVELKVYIVCGFYRRVLFLHCCVGRGPPCCYDTR